MVRECGEKHAQLRKDYFAYHNANNYNLLQFKI